MVIRKHCYILYHALMHLSIQIDDSILFSAVIDIILMWKARKTMPFYVKIRYVLKVLSAAAWVIILPVTYAYSWKNPPGLGQTIKKWFGSSPSSPSLFIMAILIYLSPNILSVLLFVFPLIRRVLERSNNKIVLFLMWWSQVCKVLL
jgi:callose synthase